MFKKDKLKTVEGETHERATYNIRFRRDRALFATASFAQQVKTDYDRSADFSRYKTYSWEKVQTQDPLWVDRIKEAVNAALAAKGLTPVESGGDIAIVAMEMTKNQQTLNTFYDGFGGAGAGAGEADRRIRRCDYNG